MSDYHISKFEYKGHILEIKTPNTGFEYNPNPVFRGEYALGDNKFYGGGYSPREVGDKFRVWLDKQLDPNYDNKVLARKLLDSIINDYPEALPEVIELLANLKARLER